ncbi:hypothetical protein HPT25_07375 [Bacillus sp. BRMEA1]|uniref:hypothetical protein n=1 Tax=Neobacillus endophyticus TaxID=2738405 RepID=UPI001563F207|nr:hypothetical protein [Neobacillus endophyticus]NRD77318.1 hypothetical protein [Neobacillus endophyticus]
MSKMVVPNLDEFVASTCTDTTRTTGAGGLSIVYSNNGKRLTLSSAILNELSHQDSVQIAYTDDYIAIANYLGEAHTNYSLSKNKNSGVIYNTALVNEIVHRFDLDYSDRTSITFPVISVQESDSGNVVFIGVQYS